MSIATLVLELTSNVNSNDVVNYLLGKIKLPDGIKSITFTLYSDTVNVKWLALEFFPNQSFARELAEAVKRFTADATLYLAREGEDERCIISL